ncbi:hypothetical protein TNCV_4726321 [Trichonephila clavipes]|nr:hypothetical protein TNCV_4726321 [Trichonephila clavipes]
MLLSLVCGTIAYDSASDLVRIMSTMMAEQDMDTGLRQGQNIIPECLWCYSELDSPVYIYTCLFFKKRRDLYAPSPMFRMFSIHGDSQELLDDLGLEATTTSSAKVTKTELNTVGLVALMGCSATEFSLYDYIQHWMITENRRCFVDYIDALVHAVS